MEIQSLGLVLCIVLLYGVISQINAEQFVIPNWIKNNANWWHQDKISDSEFIKGIQYMIQNKIMIIPSSNVTVNSENKIPSWVKNNAGWWANDQIGDSDFISGIQYLAAQKIIKVSETPSSSISNSTQTIPAWVKGVSGWWAEGKLSDNDFVSAVQFLVTKGVIRTQS
jgi:hypothetical protein